MKYHLFISKILLPDFSKYYTFFKQDSFRNFHELQPLEMCVTFPELEWNGSENGKAQ
jgi:hypothetical protein